MRFAVAVTVVASAMLAACSKQDDGNVVVPAAPVDANQAAPADATDDSAILAALRKHMAVEGAPGEKARYLAARSDLDGDGDEDALVYVIDPMYCGTGGCPLFVVTDDAGVLGVSSTIGPAQLPIYRLDSSTDGWADLGVSVSGGGMKAAVMKLAHEAGGYPDNPTVDPAVAVEPGTAEVLIADDYDAAKPLPAN